ncbi:cell division protein ZapE [Chromobacterium haemolyticum]|uniref:Cell division protein ZapE n=1 Tax=Chromobacterium haemolyticum TaxID=394935 RepID=A0A1W0CFT6_9NEIS|nr:cell division protein ZapE [Chromobacterium haemolyticum]OQS33511.1 cell division protein ZapE [Chromobacterium haemolyticum]
MSQHTFSPDGNAHLSPKTWYQAASEKPGFIHDEAQAAAIEELDLLWHQLVEFKNKRNRFLGRSLRSPDVPKGLYFWGGVGRGKSFLMDAFYACVPYRRKRRIHFHNFMAEVHRELRALAGSKDPLLAYADKIARDTRLLCFDEFHVSDIADAMMLGRLLSALFERGVVLVTTSNYAPDGLYPNGLQRQNFLPTIELIKRELKVLNVDGGNDYRLRELTREPLFMVPADEASEEKMEQLFQRLSHGVEQKKRSIQVLGREIPVKRLAAGVIWFDFLALCDGPRAQTDYLEIATEYHTVFVSGIPKITAREASIARRFTWLVDVFYDNRVKLVASAAAEPEQLYTEGVQAGEFFRTASRLTEMQSRSYLELPHQSVGQTHDQPPAGVVL